MWYRTIDPKYELQMLSVRQKISDDNLRRQSRRPPEGYNRHVDPFAQGFTSLSAFQFLVDGVKQYTFSKKNIGILVRPSSRSVTWRNSGYGTVSDSIFKSYHRRTSFEKMLKDHRFETVNENELTERVQSSFDQIVKLYIKDGFDAQEAKLTWTEGLFRYKIGEISGIVIDQNDCESFSNGYAFRAIVQKITGLKLSLYWLDENKGFPVKISSKQVFEKLGKSVAPKILTDNIDNQIQYYYDTFTGNNQ